MAVKDSYSGSDAAATDGATSVDLINANSAALLVIAGLTASLDTVEESDDNSAWSAVADADLLYTDSNGDAKQGKPVVADNSRTVVRYRGIKRYIRAAGTNASVEVLRNYPDRSPAPQAGAT